MKCYNCDAELILLCEYADLFGAYSSSPNCHEDTCKKFNHNCKDCHAHFSGGVITIKRFKCPKCGYILKQISK